MSTLKRLRSEYLKEDEGTTISDRSFAQRLLTQAGLTRRERLDIFYSAGGKYDSKRIESVMRFRCGKIHTEETSSKSSSHKPYPKLVDRHGKPAGPRRAFYPRRSDRKPFRSSHHQAHVAENDEVDDDEVEEDSELEDLEQEALLAGDEEAGEYEPGDEEEYEEDPDEVEQIEDLKEAYAAGWRAKHSQQTPGRPAASSDPKEKGKEKGRTRGKRKTGRRTASVLPASNMGTGMEIRSVQTCSMGRIHQGRRPSHLARQVMPRARITTRRMSKRRRPIRVHVCTG